LKHPLDVANQWRTYAETQPLRFFDRDLFTHLVHSVAHVSRWINAHPSDVVLVPNATTGVNAVLQSLAKSSDYPFCGAAADDDGNTPVILLLDLEYGATKVCMHCLV
jgi:selenocysteine lyase/cysteine desulfurase